MSKSRQKSSDAAMNAAERIGSECLDKLGSSKVVGTLYHMDMAARIVDEERFAVAQSVGYAIQQSSFGSPRKGDDLKRAPSDCMMVSMEILEDELRKLLGEAFAKRVVRQAKA